MGSVGFGEIAFLVVLALLIFGPEKLPGMASSVGRTLGALRREASSTLDELKRAAEVEELRGVADELRGTGAELRAGFVPAAGSRRPAGAPRGAPGGAPGAAQAGPPPFDPDAT